MNKAKSLYIHIPFCTYICDYCDFTKLQYFTNFARSYLVSLQKELDSYQIESGSLKTIYVGGGTPTALEDDLFETLLKMLLPYSSQLEEYTFEANPETLSETKIKLLKAYHVNRVSLGVESTHDSVLKAMNRHHTFEDVTKAVERLKNNGITNLNCDLILGLPQVSPNLLKEDIARLIALNLPHISCYSLTVHEHTAFFNRHVKTVGADEERELYDLVTLELEKAGYTHYEISNYAKKGYESVHNFTYWLNEPYYGIGLGASGYLDDVRYTNTKNLTAYLKGEYIGEKETVSKEDKLEYEIMLTLRTNRGLDIKKLKEDYHYDILLRKEKEIREAISRGYLLLKDNHLICTYDGMMTLDQIILNLLP